jgi:hypothetical protein
LERLDQIPAMIEGTLTERARQRGGKEARVYHQLQRWHAGRNDTRHVPAERVDAVREGIDGYQQAQGLLRAIARLDETEILVGAPFESKKKPTRP